MSAERNTAIAPNLGASLVPKDPLERLEESLSHLKDSIRFAKAVVEHAPVGDREEIGQRLSAYEKICDQQAEVLTEIRTAVTRKDRRSLYKQIYLVNLLSRMIRDDARDIVKLLGGQSLKATEFVQ